MFWKKPGPPPGPSDPDDIALRESLRGHWFAESDDTHYYFGTGHVVMDEPFFGQKRRVVPMTYDILNSNATDRLLTIHMKPAGNKGHEERLVLSPDRKSVSVMVKSPSAGTFCLGPFKWAYVDSRTSPDEPT